MSSPKSLSVMLRGELKDQAAYNDLDLRELFSAKSGLQAYEALERLESRARAMANRIYSIRNDLAWAALSKEAK